MGRPPPFPQGGGRGLSLAPSSPGSGPVPRKVSVCGWLPSGWPGAGGSDFPTSPSVTPRVFGSTPESLVFSTLIGTISGMRGGASVSSPSPCFAPLGPSPKSIKSIIRLAGVGAVSNMMRGGVCLGSPLHSSGPETVSPGQGRARVCLWGGCGTLLGLHPPPSPKGQARGVDGGSQVVAGP